MRLVYLGTPEEAVGPLRALHAAGHEIALVVTQPDKRRGRRADPTPSPVKRAAIELGLPVSHRVKDVPEAGAEAGVVVAFGRLIKPEVLDRLTFLNLHPSLLPRWRGATPIESAILAGDERTGVCVMKLEEEMDTGPVYARAEVDVLENETSAHLGERLFALGTDLLLEVLEAGMPEPVPQVGVPTYATKITPERLHIDWNDSAVSINRLSRIGRSWTTFRGKRLLVLETRTATGDAALPGTLDGGLVSTGDGVLELVTVQPEGKAAQPADAWVRGARPEPGERLV